MVSVVGPDRPGIVKEISGIVAGAGCNIEDSRMAHLGGEFALIMLVSGEAGAPEAAGEGVRGWAGRSGMTSVVRPTTAPENLAAAAAEIELDMPDQPGIVSRVTRFLAERGANVEDLEAGVRPAPFTGTPSFSMHVRVRSAGEISLEELRDALHDLAADEDIHITVGTSG